VVLTVGCDKIVPAYLMVAATVDIPAIALSVGPMLNGWYEGKRVGSGTIIWKAARAARHRSDRPGWFHAHRNGSDTVDGLLQHYGHGNDDEFAY